MNLDGIENEKAYRKLACAIVLQAVDDYKAYLKAKKKGLKTEKDFKCAKYWNCYWYGVIATGENAERFLGTELAHFYSGIAKDIDIPSVIREQILKGDNYANEYESYKRSIKEKKNNAKGTT